MLERKASDKIRKMRKSEYMLKKTEDGINYHMGAKFSEKKTFNR